MINMSPMVNLQPTISRSKIEREAFLIAQQHLSKDQLHWELAKAELKMEYGQEPPSEHIRELASEIATGSHTQEQLHWLIAEKKLLYQH